MLEVQHARFEVGEVESATYFVTRSNGLKTRTASHLLVHAFGFGGQRPVGERPPDCDRLQPTDLPVCARDGWLAAAKDLLQHPGERPGMACDRFMIAGNGHRARAELPGQRVGGLVHHLPRP